jgi:hypothetical protein
MSTESKTVAAMVAIYCKGHHGKRDGKLCDGCHQLLDYANERVINCPYGIDKPACSACLVHCYKPEMRQRIARVMRYAGPKMVWRHPILAVLHLVKKIRQPRKKL